MDKYLKNAGNQSFNKAVAFILVTSVIFTMVACNTGGSDQLKVLMITGGGSHDYESQKQILKDGITERISNVSVTVDFEAGDDREGFISRHENSEWAQEFDIVLYNMCFARNEDAEWSRSIVNAHVEHQIPAVIIHCAVHSYNHRIDDDTWRRFIGMKSPNHQSRKPFTVEVIETGHPVMDGFPREWVTPQGELYNVDKLYDTATVLAHSFGEGTGEYQPNIWVNHYNGVPVFGTTIGHHNETMEHEVYLDLIVNGILWSLGKLI